MKDATLRARLGRNGKAYVNRNYRWSQILQKYERLLTAVAGTPARDTSPDRERERDRPREERPERDRDRDRVRDRFRHRRPDRGRGQRGGARS
jgi:hypothetical protein